jgi:ribulose-phosphate 3-epimerase
VEVNKRRLEIAPSILSADFRVLEREVKTAQDGGADWIHCDVMDGVFVPNITIGPMVVEAVKKSVSIPLDVHLMVDSPEKHISPFHDAGADNVTVHADACENLEEVLDTIHGKGIKAGVTVNPDKPISLFEKHLDRIDIVLIMSVYAGLPAQKFIPETLSKVEELVKLRQKRNLNFKIEIDGGINTETARLSYRSGVDILVSGSYIFKSDNYKETINLLRIESRKD